MRYRVTFTVELEADDDQAAERHAADAVEGFPPPGVEVQSHVAQIEEDTPGK